MNDDIIGLLCRKAPIALSKVCRHGRSRRSSDDVTVEIVNTVANLDAYVKSFRKVTVKMRGCFYHNVHILSQLPEGVHSVDLSGNKSLPDTFLVHLSQSEAAKSTLTDIRTENVILLNADHPRHRFNCLEAYFRLEKEKCGTFPHLKTWRQSDANISIRMRHLLREMTAFSQLL